MKSLDVKILDAKPGPDTNSELVDTYLLLTVRIKFAPGMTTQKMRKRFIQAIVRCVMGYIPDEDGALEEDQFGMSIKTGIEEEIWAAKIIGAVKHLRAAEHAEIDLNFDEANLYLMPKT